MAFDRSVQAQSAERDDLDALQLAQKLTSVGQRRCLLLQVDPACAFGDRTSEGAGRDPSFDVVGLSLGTITAPAASGARLEHVCYFVGDGAAARCLLGERHHVALGGSKTAEASQRLGLAHVYLDAGQRVVE